MLTDYSSDFWKSIRVWAAQISDGTITDPDTIYTLITTATAESDSAAALLRNDEHRNVALAISKLTDAATISTNQMLKPATKAFSKLTPDQRHLLFSHVFVHDESPSILQARSLLEGRLSVAVARPHRSALADRVEGWWFRVCIEHLAGKIAYLTGVEAMDQITSLAQQFQPTSLPIDCYSEKPSASEAGQLHERVFVEQLHRVQISAGRIQNAVLDYYRAFTQRSRWVRDRLIVDDDLNLYEDKLHDEWNRIKMALEEKLDEPATEDALIALGQELFDWAELTADIRIRPQVSEPYVMRGSFHILADGNPPRLRWHRDFVSQLKAAIAQGAA